MATTYRASTAITCTLASLASSATVGQGCLAIDNSSNLYDDVMLTLAVKTSASALANDKACYLYLFGSEDGTVYNASSAEAVGTNAGVTVASPTNMKQFIIYCPAVSTTYRAVVSVSQALGFMPRKWGFVLVNFTGQALDSSEGNHQKTYSGINF